MATLCKLKVSVTRHVNFLSKYDCRMRIIVMEIVSEINYG